MKSGISSSRVLQPSTYVRLLIDRAEGVFVKSYRPIYTIEIFEIYKVVEGYPTLYYLKDLQGEIIKGCVYRDEINPVTLPETYVVESVLDEKICPKSKRKLYYVKFLGYPPKFNSWTPYIEKIKK